MDVVELAVEGAETGVVRRNLRSCAGNEVQMTHVLPVDVLSRSVGPCQKKRDSHATGNFTLLLDSRSSELHRPRGVQNAPLVLNRRLRQTWAPILCSAGPAARDVVISIPRWGVGGNRICRFTGCADSIDNERVANTTCSRIRSIRATRRVV